MHHLVLFEEKTLLRDLPVADIAACAQGTIPASHTAHQSKAVFAPRISLTANHTGCGIKIVSHSRTMRVPGRCDGGYIST